MPPWAWGVWEKARAHRGGQHPAQTGGGGSNGKGDGVGGGPHIRRRTS